MLERSVRRRAGPLACRSQAYATMALMTTFKPLEKPCPSCPWRVDQHAEDIQGFSLQLAEELASTCPDPRGYGPDFGAPLFACHQSKIGAEVRCAGWLAKVGHTHPNVRLSVAQGQLDPVHLAPRPDWPLLHDDYGQVLDKLRSSTNASNADA